MEEQGASADAIDASLSPTRVQIPTIVGVNFGHNGSHEAIASAPLKLSTKDLIPLHRELRLIASLDRCQEVGMSLTVDFPLTYYLSFIVYVRSSI